MKSDIEKALSKKYTIDEVAVYDSESLDRTTVRVSIAVDGKGYTHAVSLDGKERTASKAISKLSKLFKASLGETEAVEYGGEEIKKSKALE